MRTFDKNDVLKYKNTFFFFFWFWDTKFHKTIEKMATFELN